MNQHTIHETIIRDIFDIARDLKDSDEVERVRGFQKGASMKSITSKAGALTMVFPVYCSRNMSYTSACMISKAIERKAVTLLQMLFSAANITDAENGIDYISNFHTNLNMGRMSVDDFMHAMDTFVDENGLLDKATSQYNDYKAIQEDMKAMNFYFECDENINDVPLDCYKVVSVGEGKMLVNEADEWMHETILPDGTYKAAKDLTPADKGWIDNERSKKILAKQRDTINGLNVTIANQKGQIGALINRIDDLDNYVGYSYDQGKNDELVQQGRERLDFEKQKYEDQRKDRKDDIRYRSRQIKLQMDKNEIDREKADWQNRKAAEDIMKIQADIARNRLVDNDVKKANELVPTLMYVNFIHKGDQDSKYPIATSMVVGVKAKLYAIDGEDIMNRLKFKHNDKNLMLKLAKVSTREISFFKDFLFCIDKAKIDALSQSRRGSSNKAWKILERRAQKSKLRRLLNMKNDATAITTLCITQDEAEYMRKTQYIDVENPAVIRPIMDAYNLMGFVIADEALEICKFMFDEDDKQYEVLTYDNLEREQKDNTKKILNLMTKM